MPHYGLKHYDNKENEGTLQRRVDADPFLQFLETSTKKYKDGGYNYSGPLPHEQEMPMKDQINVKKFNPDTSGNGGPGMDIDTIKTMGVPTDFPAYDQDQDGNTRYPCKSWLLTGPRDPIRDENLLMTPYKGKHYNDIISQIRNDLSADKQ
tara:strand:+ start:259 stop:711 length:453 start_codon:yes stop_codon:yes gene_type:complete